MYLLSQEELAKIKNRVALAEVHNASLSVDLVDHICCMIEERVERGTILNAAAEEVFKEMGEVQLKAIDNETKLLTQNKFVMKKRTKIIGMVALVLMVLGFIMKQLHLMGAGVAWGVGVLFAVFGFALLLTVDNFKYAQSVQRKALSIIGYIGSASFILGSGFKLLHQPGSNYMIAIGGVALLIYFILNNTMSRNVEPK
jgi:hypothetical protein